VASCAANTAEGVSVTVRISLPVCHLPSHQVARDQILADMVTRHAQHPRLGAVQRVVAKMPAQRRYSQPWDTVRADRDVAERNTTAVADVLTMGLAAAQAVLAAHRVDPAEIDCVVTSHATGDAVPGLDVHLIAGLGLRPDVSRRPMTQLGCAGGAHGLVLAADHVRAHPGSTVLLVVAESLSSIYHHSDTGIEMMIFKALWGDSGTAVLVTDRPLGPGLEIADTWEYVVPGSHTRYRKRLDAEGVHFDSDKTAPSSINDLAPALRQWLAGPLRGTARPSVPRPRAETDPAGWPLDFVVSHTGGPAILTDLQKQLDLPEDALRHSWESMDEYGNLGGASVLDVLRRTHTTPPPAGAHGLLLGFGPGFTASALKTVWRDE